MAARSKRGGHGSVGRTGGKERELEGEGKVVRGSPEGVGRRPYPSSHLLHRRGGLRPVDRTPVFAVPTARTGASR